MGKLMFPVEEAIILAGAPRPSLSKHPTFARSAFDDARDGVAWEGRSEYPR